VIIDLFKNEELIPKEHFVSYQLNGDKKIIKFSKTDIDLCHYHVSYSVVHIIVNDGIYLLFWLIFYQGTIRGNPNSQVAVSTCKGIRGVIHDGTETFYIETGANEMLNADHFLYK
jgi:Reprolysin family propeptide